MGCEVAPAEIRIPSLSIANPALYQSATSEPSEPLAHCVVICDLTVFEREKIACRDRVISKPKLAILHTEHAIHGRRMVMIVFAAHRATVLPAMAHM